MNDFILGVVCILGIVFIGYGYYSSYNTASEEIQGFIGMVLGSIGMMILVLAAGFMLVIIVNIIKMVVI